MNEIDLLTLKLLTSKKQYNNYLANANPGKSAEIEEYKSKVIKYVPRIKKLIVILLDAKVFVFEYFVFEMDCHRHY